MDTDHARSLPDGYDETDRAMLDAIVAQPGLHRTDYAKLRPEQLPAKYPDTPTVQAFDRRAAMARENPLLSLAYLVEAIADGRAYADCYDTARIEFLGKTARAALRATGHLEKAYDLYPLVNR
jgi:hypothetical protein